MRLDGMLNARRWGWSSLVVGERGTWTGAMMGVATMTMMAARLQVDRDREFVRLGLMMLTALAVAVKMVMWW